MKKNIIKVNTKKINKIFLLSISFVVFSNFVFAEGDDVKINQVVNNDQFVATSTSTTVQNYSAGLAYSSTNTIYPINYKTQIVFTTKQTGNIPEPVNQNIPSGYFVPGKNEFVIVSNIAPKINSSSETSTSTNYGIVAYDENDLCHNVPGIQTQIEKGWIQNTYKECFFVLGNIEVIRFSFMPEKFVYPVDYSWLRKVMRIFSSGSENKNLILDPYPNKDIKIDLVGSIIYIFGVLSIFILFITSSRAIYHNKNLWKAN